MGAILISGIQPPMGCNEIPYGGVSLDDIEPHTSHVRFHDARRIFREWQDWKDEEQDLILNEEPVHFLNWCIDEGIDS